MEESRIALLAATAYGLALTGSELESNGELEGKGPHVLAELADGDEGALNAAQERVLALADADDPTSHVAVRLLSDATTLAPA